MKFNTPGVTFNGMGTFNNVAPPPAEPSTWFRFVPHDPAQSGGFWNVDNPAAVWGPFDPDAEIVFPIDVEGWLAQLATAYGSHQILAPAPLACVSEGTFVDGVFQIRMKLASDASFRQGVKYPFTIRIVGDDGQKDDRTVKLKVKSR